MLDLLDRKSEVRISTALLGLVESLKTFMSFFLDVISGLALIPNVLLKIAFNAVTLLVTDKDKDTSDTNYTKQCTAPVILCHIYQDISLSYYHMYVGMTYACGIYMYACMLNGMQHTTLSLGL